MKRAGNCSLVPRWWVIILSESRSSLESSSWLALGCTMVPLWVQDSEVGIVAALVVRSDLDAAVVALGHGVHTEVGCLNGVVLEDAGLDAGMEACWEMNGVLAATCRLKAVLNLPPVFRMRLFWKTMDHSRADELLVSHVLPGVEVDRSQSGMVPSARAACVGQIPQLRAAVPADQVEAAVVAQVQAFGQND